LPHPELSGHAGPGKPARARRRPFAFNTLASNSRRWVDDWLPLHAWTVEEVWSRIGASGVRHHPAYDLGMPRLSCCFCIFSPRSALILAGKHNPELLAEYVKVEKQIGHSFRNELPLLLLKYRKPFRTVNRPVSSRTGSCNTFNPEVRCESFAFHPALAGRLRQLPAA
jgi:hypothetical protein